MIYVEAEPGELIHPPQHRQAGFGYRVRWALLVSTAEDGGAELHAFAAKLGLRRAYWHAWPFPHYDLSGALYERAKEGGAIPAGRTALFVLMGRSMTA